MTIVEGYHVLRASEQKRKTEPPDDGYDAEDDFSKSIDACYEAVRERVKRGGKGWQ